MGSRVGSLCMRMGVREFRKWAGSFPFLFPTMEADLFVKVVWGSAVLRDFADDRISFCVTYKSFFLRCRIAGHWFLLHFYWASGRRAVLELGLNFLGGRGKL